MANTDDKEKNGGALGSTTPSAPTEDMVQIPRAELTQIMESLAAADKARVDTEARMAGLEAMVADSKGSDATGEKMRERKSYEPQFRTLKLRKFPIAGDINNMGIVIGWTDRGAYQEVDRTGPVAQYKDMIDIIFLDKERNADGKLQAQQVALLDLLNSSFVTCKIVDTKKVSRTEPTGEEIDVTTWDPNHGLMATGDKVDGYVAYTDITYVVQLPGRTQPVEVDAAFVN